MVWTCPTGLATALALLVGGLLLPPLAHAAAAALGVAGLGLLWAVRRGGGMRREAPALLAIFALGAGAGALRREEAPPFLPTAATCTLAGEVLEWRPLAGGVSLRLRVHRRDGRAVPPAVVRVSGGARWPKTPRSRWLRVSGRFLAERGATTPGAPWGHTEVSGSLLVDREGLPEWGPGGAPAVVQTQGRLSEVVREFLPGFGGRFGEAVLFGWSTSLTAHERDVFRRSGASHLVAVSGLNVGLVAGLVALVLGGAAPSVRLAGIVASGWIYAAMAGWSPSVLRAAATLSAVSLGNTLRRARSGPAWLCLAVAWLLWFRPALALSVSFQLSVAAVAGLFLALDVGRVGAGRLHGLLTSILACLGAQWATLPITVSVFGTFSPLSVVPNLVVVPLSGFFLPALLLMLLVRPVLPAAETMADATQVLARLIEETLAACAEWMPFWTGLPRPATPVLVAFAVLPMVWFGLCPSRRSRPAWRRGALLVAALLVGGVFWVPGPPPGPWYAFLDVGQGDAAVLRLSDGTVWVVDVGDDRGPGDAARNVLLPFLRRERVRRVDGLIVSHRHRDHVGALASFLEERRVDRIWDAGYGAAGGTSGWMDSLFAARGTWPCLVAAGDTLHRAPGVCVVALHPERGDPVAEGADANLNDRSLVLRVEDGGRMLLLVGDLERSGEDACLARGASLQADLLKVGHHGSATSSAEAFLDTVAPRQAVVSCGDGNRFGHPNPGTLAALEARRITTWRTDLCGTLIFRPRSGGWNPRAHPPRGPDP